MNYKYTIETIQLSRVFVDGELQRPEQPAHVADMAANWNDLAEQIPVLSLRANGYYHTLDGQHTIKALRKRGVIEFTAMVYYGLTEAEEAEAFVIRNGKRKGVGNIHKFNVSVKAEFPLQVAVNDILTAHGWRVGNHDGAFLSLVLKPPLGGQSTRLPQTP